MSTAEPTYWQDVAQDLAEALVALTIPLSQLDAEPEFLRVDALPFARENLPRAEALLKRLTYDTESSRSSQNYIDTGLRLLTEPPDPEVLVGYVDAGDEEELEDERHGQLLLACPWKGCRSTSFYEVDRAERWNPVVYDDVNVFRAADVQPDRLREFDGYVPGTAFARYRDGGPNPKAGLPIVSIQQGSDGDGYSTSHHLCQSCHRRVSLPEWLDAEWQ